MTDLSTRRAVREITKTNAMSAAHVRGDSDPDMDEALRRVQTNLAYLQRDRQLAAEVAAQIQMGTAA
jgi:hypothetical protein